MDRHNSSVSPVVAEKKTGPGSNAKIGDNKHSPASRTLRQGNDTEYKQGDRYSAPLSFRIPNSSKTIGGEGKDKKGWTPPGGFDGMHPLPPQFPPYLAPPWAPNNHFAQQVHSELSYPEHGSRPHQPVTSWMRVRGSARTQSEPVVADGQHRAAKDSNGRPTGAGVNHDDTVAPGGRSSLAPVNPKHWLREMEKEWTARQGMGEGPGWPS